jgi:hypothetical protein
MTKKTDERNEGSPEEMDGCMEERKEQMKKIIEERE